MEELVNVQHSLYGWLGIIQSLSLGNGICQISSDVCPAGCAFGIWNFIVSTIAVTHQITLEAVKKIYGIIPGSGLRVFIEDNRWSSVFTAAEQPHI